MEIVNVVYRGKLQNRVDLEKLYAQNKCWAAKIYRNRPRQVIIKFHNKTLLAFESGSVRIMGKCDEVDALLTLLSFFDENDVPKCLQLQTITMSGKFKNKINLFKLPQIISCEYNFELFAGVRITKYAPMCVNVFTSGACVITGCKDENVGQQIFNELDLLTEQCKNI